MPPPQTENHIDSCSPYNDLSEYQHENLCLKSWKNDQNYPDYKGTSWKSCSRINDIREIFNKCEYENLEYLLISCGVNDIDYLKGTEVHDKIISLINDSRNTPISKLYWTI